MYLYADLLKRADADNPVKVGLIGAGKFSSMFLSQVPSTPGLHVHTIADLSPERARANCAEVGWPQELIDATRFTDDSGALLREGEVDVVVEATGNPVVGLMHARQAIENGLHIVMVNVEADVLAGAALAKQAHSAGVVYLSLIHI